MKSDYFKVIRGGLNSTFQDNGRKNLNHIGIPVSGIMDRRNYMEFESSKIFLERSGFNIIEHYYRPKGKPREEQPWLAIVSRCKKS